MAEEPELTAARVATGSIYLTLQNILSTAIGVLGYGFMARMISREEMGVVAALTLLATLISLLSGFGLNQTLAKFVSELKGRKEDVSTHVVSALSFRAPVSFLLALALFASSSHLSNLLFRTNAYSSLMALLAADSFLISVSPLLNSVLWGLGKLKEMATYTISSRTIRWACIAAFLMNGYGLFGVLLGWVIGDLTLLLLYSFKVKNYVKFSGQKSLEGLSCLPELLRFSWPLYLASTVYFLYTWYDRALILAFLPLSDLGVYNIAYMAFSMLASIAMSLGSALLPYYGMAYGRNDHKAITAGIRRASKYTMLVMFPLALGLATAAKPTITLFADQQYEQGWPILATLSLFGLVYGLSPALSNLLLIYGKTKTILLLNLVSVVSSLALLPLVRLLNLTGLAVVRGASLLLTFTLSLHFISKTVKIEIDREVAAKTLASSVVMAVAVTAIQQLIYSKLLLPLYIATGATIYITAIRTLKTLNQEDAQLIKQITGERYSKYISKILDAK